VNVIGVEAAASPIEEADLSQLQQRRDRLRAVLAQAEEDRVELDRHCAVEEAASRRSQARRWLPPGLRFLLGAAVGIGLAFLVAYGFIYPHAQPGMTTR
jgi:hypothetical protein